MAHEVSAPAIQRLRRLLNQRVRPLIVTAAQPMTVEATAESFDIVSFDEASSLTRRPFSIGEAWGRPWHTTWFKMMANLSPDVTSVLAVSPHSQLVAHVDLGFTGRGDGFQVEGMAWFNGSRVQAVQPDRRLIPLSLSNDSKSNKIELWVEAAATPIIAGHESGYGATPLGDPATAGDHPLYSLRRAEVGIFNSDVSELAVLLHALMDLLIDMDGQDPQRARLFAMVEDVEGVLDLRDVPGSARNAVDYLQRRLRDLPGNVSGDQTHRIFAAGHAHLDTAWLWPLRETRRKAVRTFVNAVGLLQRNADARFSHSQAQHYEWVEVDAPEVFDEVRALVANGQWEPVGGMWVETDLNLPDGESLLRQFIHGQRAFVNWFGQRSEVAFLPDDFGYPASLPQIVRHAGGRWFFTQKMSWNETNTFPHHTFWWEGIDGSRLFTHFSPVETYNALLTPSQMRFAERNFLDHRGASQSLALFGHGDGGGGPTQEMIDRGRLSRVLPSVPRVEFGSVASFFQSAHDEYATAAPVWVGEMYLEKHRGTYTSQIRTKQGNRNCERLLHELELWSACAGVEQPDLFELWKRVLTQQFHDIIPGSSIAWVHRDAEREHQEVATIIEDRLSKLLGSSDVVTADDSNQTVLHDVFNPAPVDRREVIIGQRRMAWVEVPAFGQTSVELTRAAVLPADTEPVTCKSDQTGSITMSNGLISCTIDATGVLTDLVVCASGRNIIGRATRGDIAGGQGTQVGHLAIRRDTPAEYDAWDIDRADADRASVTLTSGSPPAIDFANVSAAQVSSTYTHGASTFVLRWTLRAGSSRVDLRLEADWHGTEERLQWVMPVNVLARDAVCGIQFGHVRRARHQNTAWDAARFEVCAHRYVRISEPGCGVALMADGPRGYDIRNHGLSLSLLRAPQFPDPQCDIGLQTIEWSLYLDHGQQDVGSIEMEAARIAHPMRIVPHGPDRPRAPVVVDATGVFVSALKMADDASGDLIVRLVECRGAHTSGTVTVARRSMNADIEIWRCNALEDRESDAAESLTSNFADGYVASVSLAPFEIRTLRIRSRPKSL